MAQPRIAYHDKLSSTATKSLWLHADAVTTPLAVGDILQWSSGLTIFDTETEGEVLVGVSMGKTTTEMTSGVGGDYIPVATQCIVEMDLVSATYVFGAPVGYDAGVKNTFTPATGGAPVTMGWYWGHDLGAASTRGLVLIDILAMINSVTNSTEALFATINTV